MSIWGIIGKQPLTPNHVCRNTHFSHLNVTILPSPKYQTFSMYAWICRQESAVTLRGNSVNKIKRGCLTSIAICRSESGIRESCIHVGEML